MNKDTIMYLIIMFFAFLVDSLLSYFLPYNFTYHAITLIPYVSIIVFTLLNNIIDESDRYLFAIICGLFYTVVYTDGYYLFILIFCLYAFIGKRYMKRSRFTLFEGLAMIILNILIHENILYFGSVIANGESMNVLMFAIMRLFETLILNVVLYIPIFFIIGKIDSKSQKQVYFDKN